MSRMYTVEGLKSGWTILNELTGELQKEGIFFPNLILADLRNAKMVVEYLDSFGEDIGATDEADTDLQVEIERKIITLSRTLLEQAGEKGDDYRLEWQRKFEDAINGRLEGEENEAKTPISDIPRDKDTGFFRIKLPDEIPVEVVSEMAEDCRVNISLDGERHLQVSGSKDCVRDAMKRLGELFYGKSKIQ